MKRVRKDNIEVKTAVLDKLAAVEFTHTYIIGFTEGGMVKAAIVENADQILPLLTVAEPQASSHKSVWGIRMRVTAEGKDILKTYAREIFDVCSIKFLEQEYAEHGNRGGNNRGHIFERLCAEVMGGTRPDSMTAKCTETGDIIVDGEHFQCKLWNATVTTEPQVMEFYSKMMAGRD